MTACISKNGYFHFDLNVFFLDITILFNLLRATDLAMLSWLWTWIRESELGTLHTCKYVVQL